MENTRYDDAMGQKELEMVLSMLVIVSYRDSGYDVAAEAMRPMQQLGEAVTFLSLNKCSIPAADRSVYEAAIQLGVQIMIMGVGRLQRSYRKAIAHANPALINTRVDLRALSAQADIDVKPELRVHQHIMHPFSKAQLIAEMGQQEPKVEGWYLGACKVWHEAHRIGSPEGNDIMDGLTQGTFDGGFALKFMLRDLHGLPATQPLVRSNLHPSPIRMFVTKAALDASLKNICAKESSMRLHTRGQLVTDGANNSYNIVPSCAATVHCFCRF